MNVIKLLLIAIFILITQSAEALEKEFKIGVMLCLTGDCAEWGNNSLKGIQLAVKELNANSGILGRQVSIIVEDTREGAGGANAIAAYQNLILNSEIQYLIGPTWSIGGAPLAPIIAKNKNLIATSPSLGIADFNEAGNHIFNVWPHDSVSSEKLAEYAIAQGWKRGVIFDANDPWGVVQADTFALKFQELGGEVIKRVSNTPDASSFRAEALTVKQLNPDFVFQANMYKMAQFAKDLKRISFGGKQITILMDETRLHESQGALEGAIFAKYPEPTGEFIRKYNQEYNTNPGVTADTAYDVIKLYALAISRVGTFDLNQVQKEMLKIKMDGASGGLSFDAKGGVVKEPAIYQVVNEQELPITK